MKKWGDLSVRVRLMSMVGISVVSLLIVFGMALSSFRAIGVESVLSKQDRLLAVVGGDFENPLASVLNAYPIAVHAQREKSREAVENARKTVHEMRGSYEQRLAEYDREVTDSDLHAAIKDAQSAGEAWYDLLEREYFPALLEGRTDDAIAVWQNRMEPIYGRHDAAILKITDMVNSGMDATDKKVDANEGKYRMWMGVATGLASLVVFFIGLVTARQIWTGLAQVNRAMKILADNDLTAALDLEARDEIGEVARSYNFAIENLRAALEQVAQNSKNASESSQHLAAASHAIASGAQEQAASLEETAASLEQITASVQLSADNARQASQFAVSSKESAERGREVVSSAIAAMSEINASSFKISEIISTIDEIAFQTNLLAVNAAVEAARAGEEGRGFAVVASEVRSLAQRSAVAAKEIKGLIQDSLRKVEVGSDLVNKSGETLSAIVSSVKRVTDIVSEIAATAGEQRSGIEQVNSAMSQMDQVTQSNSAQTEELSGTAESLSEQSALLLELIDTFTLNKADTGLRSERPNGPASSRISVVSPRSVPA